MTMPIVYNKIRHCRWSNVSTTIRRVHFQTFVAIMEQLTLAIMFDRYSLTGKRQLQSYHWNVMQTARHNTARRNLYFTGSCTSVYGWWASP